MNRRTLKKACKRAVAVLIAKHGYSARDFVPAKGDESIYAPQGMEERCVRRYEITGSTWLEPGPLKGTPLYSYRCSYEYDEWDVKLPIDLLDEIETWEGLTVEDIAALMADEPATHEDLAEAA